MERSVHFDADSLWGRVITSCDVSDDDHLLRTASFELDEDAISTMRNAVEQYGFFELDQVHRPSKKQRPPWFGHHRVIDLQIDDRRNVIASRTVRDDPPRNEADRRFEALWDVLVGIVIEQPDYLELGDCLDPRDPIDWDAFER